MRDIMSTMGGYLEYCGGYSVPWGYLEYRGGVQYHGGYHPLKFENAQIYFKNAQIK